MIYPKFEGLNFINFSLTEFQVRYAIAIAQEAQDLLKALAILSDATVRRKICSLRSRNLKMQIFLLTVASDRIARAFNRSWAS